MNTARSFVARPSLVTLALVASAALLGASGCAGDTSTIEHVGQAQGALTLTWPGHVDVATDWLADIEPETNSYDSPASISYDVNNVLHATAECGSFTAQLVYQSYENIITTTVLSALTGSTSPGAQQWHDAIDPGQSHPNNPTDDISLLPFDDALSSPTGRTMRSSGSTLLAVGDILASKYTLGSSTGHVMTVKSFTAPPVDQSLTLTGTRVIPDVTNVKRWTVVVFDSTSSVHGSSDSRYQNDSSESDGNDHGIGEGTIYLYEDATTGSSTLGQLVGWTWSTASSYTYQFTNTSGVDNNGKTTYRRMVIGRFSGGDL